MAAILLVRAAYPLAADKKRIEVPTAPPQEAAPKDFRDGRYGVRFQLPPGWSINRKDHEISTFRLDARSATRKSQMRAVAALEFNPFPSSTFSGALFYYSVARHTTDAECAREATSASQPPAEIPVRDIQNIGGMDFRHGHDEHGDICVEARDEVYTAYRRGACYRFDLAMNTFCSVSSGAHDLTDDQMRSIEERMTTILSSVALDWEKSGPHPVPVPPIQADPQPVLPPVTSGAGR